MIVSIFMAYLCVPTIDVTGDGTGDYPPPVEGDWVVINATHVSNETIVLNGDLIVEENSTLILDSVTILFNSSLTNPKGIFVDWGSTLNIYHSNITTLKGLYTFDIFGNMSLEDSLISNVTGGIFIEFGNVIIDNCTIYNNIDFAISAFGNPLITNNTIVGNHGGILTGFGSAPLIYNNTITYNEWGIICNSAGFAQIIGNDISHNSLGGINVELGHFEIHNNTISSNGGIGIRSDHAKINATNNTIYDNERWGIYSIGAPITQENNYFERAGKFNGEGDVLLEWEVLVSVFDSDNNSVENVNITIFDKHETLTWTGNTIGNIRFVTLREYEITENQTLLIHTPFSIVAKFGNFTNTTLLDITGSKMSIFESNTAVIILEIEEEPVDEVEVKEYVFPTWGLMVVAGIWIFVAILFVIGIIMVVLDRKRRMN
jgi:parallel beta-helix repeat protein